MKQIIDTDIFCNYASDISNRFSFTGLNNSIKQAIKDGLIHDNDNEQTSARKLFLSFVETEGNFSEVRAFIPEFTLDYKRGKRSFGEYKLSDKVINELVDDVLLSYIISQTSDFSKADPSFSDVLYLSKVIRFDNPTVVSITNRLYEISPSLDLIDSSIIIGRLSSFNALFENYVGYLEVQEDTACLAKVLSLYTGARTNPSGTSAVPVIAELATADHVLVMLNFCLIVYRLSKETIEIKPILENILTTEENWKILFALLNSNHQFIPYNLYPLRELIFKDIEYSQDHLDLIKRLLDLKEDQTYSVSNIEMAEVIKRVCSKLISQPTSELSSTLESWTRTERLKKVLIENIEQLTIDDITRLPDNLIHLAFDKITQADNIFLYQDNLDVLKALANKGSEEHVFKLLKVIKIKLQQGDKINQALEILENIDRLSETQAYLIEADISTIENENLREEALSILTNKTGLIKNSTKNGVLNVLKATYRSDRNRVVRNVTRKLRSLIADNKVEVTITNQLVDGHDPDPGFVKKLFIEYEYGGARKNKEIDEGHVLTIPE